MDVSVYTHCGEIARRQQDTKQVGQNVRVFYINIGLWVGFTHEPISMRERTVAADERICKDFYKSAAWKRARQTVIKRANGLCERCRAAGLYRPGVIVHHKDYITPENIHNPGVTLNLDNLEYLCEDCHNKEHKASLTIVIGLTVTENYYRQKEKSGGPLPGGLILDVPTRTEGDTSKKLRRVARI